MSMRKSVGINTFPLYGKSEGVRRYVEEIILAMSDLDRLSMCPISIPTHRGGVHSVFTAPKVGFPLRLAYETLIGPSLSARRVDILHYTDTYGPILPRRPVVITVHDTTFITHRENHERWVANWLTLMTRMTWPAASKFIAVSTTTANDLGQLGIPKDMIRVIPHGVDHASLRSGIDNSVEEIWGRRYIAYLGNIEPRKGVGTLISAFRSSLERLPPGVNLVLAGKNAWGPSIDDLIGVDRSRIMVCGRLEEPKVASLLKNAELFVYPSEYEGFGLPPLEAASFGTPVLVGDTPVAREILRDTAKYFTPGNSEELSKAICEQILIGRDTGLERRMSHAHTFSWRRAAEQTLAVYQEVLR